MTDYLMIMFFVVIAHRFQQQYLSRTSTIIQTQMDEGLYCTVDREAHLSFLHWHHSLVPSATAGWSITRLPIGQSPALFSMKLVMAIYSPTAYFANSDFTAGDSGARRTNKTANDRLKTSSIAVGHVVTWPVTTQDLCQSKTITESVITEHSLCVYHLEILMSKFYIHKRKFALATPNVLQFCAGFWVIDWNS